MIFIHQSSKAVLAELPRRCLLCLQLLLLALLLLVRVTMLVTMLLLMLPLLARQLLLPMTDQFGVVVGYRSAICVARDT